MRRKAFTLSELLVAMGLMVALLAGAGVVFRSAVQSQRASIALSEIMRKFRGITDQLDSDFRGLRKDGEIAIIWVAADDGNGGYDRFDRIMFFANGNFQTYNEQPKMLGPPLKRITGDLARVCYMLAKNGSGVSPQAQPKEMRILSRTQHILTGDADLVVLPDLTSFSKVAFWFHNFRNEYDNSYGDILGWMNVPTSNDKADMLSIIMGKRYPPSTIDTGGTTVDPADPDTIHMLLCEGVGEFKIQSWYDDGLNARWFPIADPDGNGSLGDGDFFDPPTPYLTSLIYPGFVAWNDPANPSIPNSVAVDATNFFTAPGLGRALKFTFTLYDSREIYKNGKTFTHIVWLDN